MFSRVGLLAACGFGLSKAVVSLGYLSAMGSVERSVGYVTELWFMLASEVSSLLIAACVIALVAKGVVVRGSLAQWPALACALAGFLMGGLGLLSWMPHAASAIVLGVCYACASAGFSLTWLEKLSHCEPRDACTFMVAGLFIQVGAIALLSSASALLMVAVASLAAACSYVCYRALLYGEKGLCACGLRSVAKLHASCALEQEGGTCGGGKSARGEGLGALAGGARGAGSVRAFVRAFGNEYFCLFVLVSVVGILHTSVLGSSSEHIVGDVAMWVPVCAATCVAAGVALCALRSPDPTIVYRACLPLMLVLLSLMPFVGDALGPVAGVVMIACHDVVGMLFLFYIVTLAHKTSWQSYVLTAVYLGGSNLFLFVGLAIGMFLSSMSASFGISLLTLLAFAAMYPLGIGFVVAMRHSKEDAALGSASENVPEGMPAAAPQAAVSSSSSGAAASPQTGASALDSGHVQPSSAKEVQASAEQAAAEPDWEAELARFTKHYALTRRESEICSYLVRGRSAKHIAEALVISENTVWTHVKNVYGKTGVSGKDELINLFEREALGR